jgi:hypothetical protein
MIGGVPAGFLAGVAGFIAGSEVGWACAGADAANTTAATSEAKRRKCCIGEMSRMVVADATLWCFGKAF